LEVVSKSPKDVGTSLSRVVDQNNLKDLDNQDFSFHDYTISVPAFFICPQSKSIIFSIYHQTLEWNHQICPIRLPNV
jgi:hypothetical protein